MFSLLWSEHCAYKHSRKLLRRLPTEGERVLMGPGENAGRGLGRRRLGGRLQGRVAQPPERGRAVPGRRDRRRRHPARRLRARRAADRGPRLAALRRARLGALALPVRPRRRRDRPLRQLDRRPDRRRRGLLRGALRAELPRQRDVRRPRPRRRDGPRRRGRGRQRGRADGRLDRARRDRRRLGARLGRARGGRRLEAPQRPDRRPVRGVEAARVLPRAARRGAAGLAPGPRRRRAHLVGRRDGLRRRRRDRHRRRPRAAARGRHGAVRDHGLRVAGADARGGRAGQGRRGARGLRALADRRRGRSARSPTTGVFRVLRGGEVVGEMPVAALVDGCPLYDLEPGRAGRLDLREPRRRSTAGTRRRATTLLRAARPRPSIACKRWAFEQYDSIVGSHTVRRPEAADAAVLHLPEAGARSRSRSTATAGGSPATPTPGTIEAVLECAQNLACVGAEPLGLTNCLNFGNPEKPAVAWQLDRSTQGLADACEALGVPVVGGNVSLYNETEDGPIYPTPVVGMVGELPDPERAGGLALRDGDAIALCRARSRPRSPARSWRSCAASSGPALPALPIDDGRRGDRARPRCGRRGPVSAAHDVSDGGLACALAEMAIAGGVGPSVDLDELVEPRGCSGETALFGEGAGRLPPRRRAAPTLEALGRRRRRPVRRRQRRRRPDLRSRPPRPRSPSRSPTPSAPGARSASAWSAQPA